MKLLIAVFFVSVFFYSCGKDETVQNINVEGYWNVQKDTTFTSNPANATADLFHLFKGSNAFYRFSFLKTHDFSVLTSSPRADSMISFYRVQGNQLQLPSPSPSTTNVIPGNDLLSKTDNEMQFTRLIVTKRNAATGKPEATRLDTIKYFRVTDAVKIAYFDNYLKKWHP
jgi:hypothetical protein